MDDFSESEIFKKPSSEQVKKERRQHKQYLQMLRYWDWYEGRLLRQRVVHWIKNFIYWTKNWGKR